MKSVIVLLSVAIVCSALDISSIRDNLKIGSSSASSKRQTTGNTCTNPSTPPPSSATVLNVNDACSLTSSTAFCKSGLDCTTTNGGSAYTCQFITPSTACKQNSDCGAFGGSCTGGFCAFANVLPGGSCSGDDNCISGDCTSGKCAAGASGASCSADLTCAAGLFCYSPSSSSSDGTCTSKVAAGASCLNYLDTITDATLICSKGQLCAININSTGSTTSATCTNALSVAAGGVVNQPTASGLCQANLYSVPANNGNPYASTCSATASCNDQNRCNSVLLSTCNCPSSGNGNGTCSLDACSSQFTNLYTCLFKSDFGVLAVNDALYNSGSVCRGQAVSTICCLSTSETYLPSGYCSSAAVVAPVVMLIAFLALFF